MPLLGFGQRRARRRRLRLSLPPSIANHALGNFRRLTGLTRVLMNTAQLGGIDLRRADRALKVGETIALAQPNGRRRRRFRRRRKSIPTPQIAFARDEALPRLQLGLQFAALTALDDADLRQQP